MRTQTATWLVFVALVVRPAMAENPVYFADAKLKAVVEAALGVSDPTPADMLGLSALDAGSRGITDLTGLEYATNLESLILRSNRMNDLSPLSGLIHLQTLDVSRSRVTDISALSGLTGLRKLLVDNNEIRDISALAGMTQMLHLDIHDNTQIRDISALSGMVHLQYLVARGCRISDLSALSGMKDLWYLSCAYNLIGGLSTLGGLSHLKQLEAYGNYLSSISELLGLRSLKVLLVFNNDLGDQAYCSDLQTLLKNNPGLILEYTPNTRPPAMLSASDGQFDDRVEVAWSEVCNGPAYVSYYKVYRGTSTDGPQTPVSEWQTSCRFDDKTAEPGTRFTYSVLTATFNQGSNAGKVSAWDTGWLGYQQ